MTEYNFVPLFGGAITASLPSTFTDVSDIRQVPDNQEVYLDKNGFTSIIFDILERVDKPDSEAIQLHLEDVAVEDAGNTKVFSKSDMQFLKLPEGTSAYELIATSPPNSTQRRKANEPDFVGIFLMLIRLEKQKTDILISINVPHIAGQYNKKEIDMQFGKYSPQMGEALGYRNQIIQSFEIKDWDLFVQD